MIELANGTDVYARNQYLKEQLQKRYGDRIFFADVDGKSDVLSFKDMATSIITDYKTRQKDEQNNFVETPADANETSLILQKFYEIPKSADPEQQKNNVIETAAALVNSEIRTSVASWTKEYPTPADLSRTESLKFVPPSLQLLLSTLFSEKDNDLKIAAIGQTIIQATRPRAVYSPLQFGLTVLLHQHFRSKYLIDILHALGYCLSYKEGLKFERCAAVP